MTKKTLESQQPQNKVSKISLSTRIKDLYQIFIDDNFLCSISGNDLLETRIAVGDTIDQSKLSELLYKSLKGKLASYALRYLGSRPHSENEIRQYLRKKLYVQNKETAEYSTIDTTQILDQIINNLKDLRYVNDDEFAKWLVAQRTSTNRSKSKNAIRAELQAKGIDPTLISESLDELNPESERKRALSIAEKKLKLLQNRVSEPRELHTKLSRYLISKGYSWDTTQSVVDSLLKPF